PSGAKNYIEDLSFQIALFDAMDKQTTRNSVWRYQNYGRKGEPICDKLMANQDLMITMEKIISEVDSKDFKANASVCGIIYAINGRTYVAIVDYSGKHINASEAIFKLCVYLEDAPRVRVAASPGGGIASPGMVSGPGQQLPTWTEEELASRPNRFAGPPVANMPVWTEEELQNRPDKFTGGPNLPVWTEEELEELKKKSGPQLNLPEWKGDGLVDCPNCGYSCQPDWDTCPMCNTKLKKKA
ncbi:MAG: hypothetical protein ACTSRA_08225, partial [Promethearchaeota archaeon]